MTAVTYVRVCVLVLAVHPLPCRVGGVSIVLEGYPLPPPQEFVLGHHYHSE